MGASSANSFFQDKMFLVPLTACLASFLFPATSVSVGGAISTQYFLTSYPGWVVFALLALYLLIQGFFFYRNRKWNVWLALVMGIYLAGYAIMQMANSWSIDDQAGENSFVKLNGIEVKTQIAPWLLIFGSIAVIIMALVKIISRQWQ